MALSEMVLFGMMIVSMLTGWIVWLGLVIYGVKWLIRVWKS